ncbi:serine/threonine-protein kinase [Pseudonocardia sichuanensis]
MRVDHELELPQPATAGTAAPDVAVSGAVLQGRYVLGPVIGVGSSAVVRRARDLQSRAMVAVKQFRPGASVQDVRRQAQELSMLGRLRHPGLVRLRDAGTEQGSSWVVTDLAEGPSLAERIRVGPVLPPRLVCRLGAELADALAYVHTRGVVHRDVKPANVLLDQGRARLADFGIAVAVDRTATTANGAIIGTAAYLSPEQVRGEGVGPAVDVYALGLVLLEALTGRREYPGPMVESALARLHRSPLVPEAVPATPGCLIRAMTADDPDRRPVAAEVAEELTARPAVTPVGRHRRHRYRPQRRRQGSVVDQLRGITFGAAGPGSGIDPGRTAVARRDPV